MAPETAPKPCLPNVYTCVSKISTLAGFYAALYLGLLAEAAGDQAASKSWISKAVANKDHGATGDYMYGLAKVHEARRTGAKPEL